MMCICTKPWDGRGDGHQLVAVAYKDGQLYCVCACEAMGRAGRGHQMAVVAYKNSQLYCLLQEVAEEED